MARNVACLGRSKYLAMREDYKLQPITKVLAMHYCTQRYSSILSVQIRVTKEIQAPTTRVLVFYRVCQAEFKQLDITKNHLLKFSHKTAHIAEM